MELIFTKSSIKFLKKLPAKDVERVRGKLLALLNSIKQSGFIPSGELDIKSMEGEWQGFLRMRVGKIRVIFSVDIEQNEIQIYDIAFRGSIYK